MKVKRKRQQELISNVLALILSAKLKVVTDDNNRLYSHRNYWHELSLLSELALGFDFSRDLL